MLCISEKSTEDLLLMAKDKDFIKNLENISEHINMPTFQKYCQDLISEKNITLKALSDKALLSRSFTYQIFSGERLPGRDIILRIALVAHFSLDETQRLLKISNRGALYPKNKRDAVIIYGISNQIELYEIDKTLIKLGMESLL